MGRKIPGKKHNKIKDPIKQQQIRYESIKNKINAAPLNPDDQDIPKSLLRVIDLKEKVRNGIIPEKREKRKKSVLKGLISTETKSKKKNKPLGRPEKPIRSFTQHEGETNRAFMSRINKMVQAALQEASFENKYGVDVKRNMTTGVVEGVVKRPMDVIDKLLKEKNMKKGKKPKESEDRLSKSQKRSKKLAIKKEEKVLIKGTDFSDFKDKIRFGEVAHAPPILKLPRKATVSIGAPRPGTKDLLLKNIFTQSATQAKEVMGKPKNTYKKISDSGVVDRTAKRKTLPIGVRKQLEHSRDEMVNAYRQLKTTNKLKPWL